MIGQYINTVKPMHEQFVEPSKRNASIIVPEGGCNRVAMQMLLSQVRSTCGGRTDRGRGRPDRKPARLPVVRMAAFCTILPSLREKS